MKYLQEKFHYKSRNAIYKHLKILEHEGYLTKVNNKFILNKNSFLIDNGIIIIKIINNNKKLFLYLDKKREYLGFMLENNYFKKNNLIKGDVLIVEKNKKLKNNDLGLFIIDNTYRIMTYRFQDGFYILEDNEQIILNKVNIIGKVIMVERII